MQMTRTEFMDWCSQLAEAGRDVVMHSGMRTLGIMAAGVRDATVVEDTGTSTVTAEQVTAAQTAVQNLVSQIETLATLVSSLTGGAGSGGDGGPRGLVVEGEGAGEGAGAGTPDGGGVDAQPWDAFAGIGEGGGDGGARQAYDATRGDPTIPAVPPRYDADTGFLRGAWRPGVDATANPRDGLTPRL